MGGPSLLQHLSSQLEQLCDISAIDRPVAGRVLADLLGTAGATPLSHGPAWPSNVADDHSPVEFSLAFHHQGRPTLRILGEALGPGPRSAATQLAHAHRFVQLQADRLGLAQSRYTQVRELFSPDDPQGDFGAWQSVVFRPGQPAGYKVYFNPEIRGVERAPELVAEALHRLGLRTAYGALLGGLRPGQLGRADRFAFFAVDLHDGPHARVKVYLAQHDADVHDVVAAAGVVPGVEPDDVAQFCATACGSPGPYDGRPLISSYTILPWGGRDAGARPVGYSLYVPIRSYVADDEEARARVRRLLDRYGFDGADLDRAIRAITGRPLDAGVGLIAHVSLRLGPPQPGVTVYLSAEAYQVNPSRPRRVPAL